MEACRQISSKTSLISHAILLSNKNTSIRHMDHQRASWRGRERLGITSYTICTLQIQCQLKDAVYSETPTLLMPTHHLWALLAGEVAAFGPITEDAEAEFNPLPCTPGANKSNKQNESKLAKKFLPVILHLPCTTNGPAFFFFFNHPKAHCNVPAHQHTAP